MNEFLGPKLDLFQSGEFKFPDVSSPLSKILARKGGDFDSAFGFQPFGGLGSPDSHLYRSASNGYGSDGSSPNFDEPSSGLGGGIGGYFARGGSGAGAPGGSKFDFAHRSESPGSDAGYGTSYGSAMSSNTLGNASGYGGADERDIADILVRFN